MSGINGSHRKHYRAGAPIYIRSCSCPACSRKAKRLAKAEDARREQQSVGSTVRSRREQKSVRSSWDRAFRKLGELLTGMKSAAA